MTKFLLDENISPKAVPVLWGAGADTYHVRDRGLLGWPDYKLWELAQAEARAVITINEGDFVKLAQASAAHHGLVVLQGGATREEQIKCVLAAVDWSRSVNAILPSFADHVVRVDLKLSVAAEVVRIPLPTPVVVQVGSKKAGT